MDAAYPEYVGEHLYRVLHGVNAARVVVTPGDGHLGDGHAQAASDKEDLDVEGEAVDFAEREELLGGIGAKELETALRVTDAWKDKRPHQEVKHSAHALPIKGLTLFQIRLCLGA